MATLRQVQHCATALAEYGHRLPREDQFAWRVVAGQLQPLSAQEWACDLPWEVPAGYAEAVPALRDELRSAATSPAALVAGWLELSPAKIGRSVDPRRKAARNDRSGQGGPCERSRCARRRSERGAFRLRLVALLAILALAVAGCGGGDDDGGAGQTGTTQAQAASACQGQKLASPRTSP